MSISRFKSLLTSRYTLAVVSGICQASAFPDIGLTGGAWIAPGLLLFSALGLDGKESFRVGFAGALAHYAISLSWLLNIPYRWLGIPVAPAAGWLALSAFMALWTGLWVWIMNCTAQAFAGYSRSNGPPEQRFFLQAVHSLPRAWIQRLLWPLAGAAGWVAMEMFVTRIFGGFPWNLLAASQYQLTPLIQIAAVTGIYGVSFIIVWFSLSLISAGAEVLRSPGRSSAWVMHLFPPVLAIAAALHLGVRQLSHTPPAARQLRVALLQPSIPQTLIWDAKSDEVRFQALLALCRSALSDKPDLIIWPEAAIPKLLRYDSATYQAVTALAREHQVWMIVGADDAEPRRDTPAPSDADYYNSSFLISPDGKLTARYHKRNLVIFGEYVPLVKWLPFLSWFTPIQGGFTPGDKAVPFRMDDLGVEASVLICYEDVFPLAAKSATAESTDFLVNITNNGWFGEGAAQWQHAVSGLFRAIENRRPLIRCTNSGLTCWIDTFGRLKAVFRDSHGSIYGTGIMTFELPLPAPNDRVGQTFYNRYGDVFGWVCVVVTMLPIGLAGRTLRRPKQVPSADADAEV